MKSNFSLGNRVKIRITHASGVFYTFGIQKTKLNRFLRCKNKKENKKEETMAYVLSKEGKQLMPCANVVARLLLKDNKAKVKSRLPFVIKLTIESTEYTQMLILKVDTGSGKIGSAVVDEHNNVVYMSVIEIRNDISGKMTQRSKYRRNRRNRKTRYRKPRFNNRGNSTRKDRFSPTMKSKIDSHEKEIKFVNSILPITNLVLETGSFDPHALQNPEVLQDLSLYQRGINFGFANTKAFVLDRDGYKCQNKSCKCNAKQPKLEVHHIIYRSQGGSDQPENLVVLCKECHDGLHKGVVQLKLTGKKKGQLKHATQMNSIRVQLLKRYPDAVETFGFKTKEYRQLLGLPKEHHFDAVAMESGGMPVNFKTKDVFIKKCVSDGDYQMRKGVRSEQVIPLGKIMGFRKFDAVEHLGKRYFLKGRMTTGYAILMDIEGKKIDFKPMAKFELMKRLGARKTWMIDVRQIA